MLFDIEKRNRVLELFRLIIKHWNQSGGASENEGDIKTNYESVEEALKWGKKTVESGRIHWSSRRVFASKLFFFFFCCFDVLFSMDFIEIDRNA